MAEPDDMSQATCMQKAFVVLRMILYFVGWLGCILAVSVWHIWNEKLLKALNLVQSAANKWEKACVFTYQLADLLQNPTSGPPTKDEYVDKCNFFLYSVSAGTVYAFIFFFATLALLFNRRVTFKYLEIGELCAAVLFFLSAMIAGALVTNGIRKSCDYYLSNDFCTGGCQNQRSDSSCAATVNYGFTHRYVILQDLKDYMKWMVIVQDGVWTACVAFFLLATILFIRYRTIHRQGSSASSKYKNFDSDTTETGDNATEMGAVADPGYETKDPSPMGDPEGNPFG